MKRVQWIRAQGEDPYYRSVEGRFEIDPQFCGRTTAQGYILRDRLTGNERRGLNTITYCKREADLIVERERDHFQA